MQLGYGDSRPTFLYQISPYLIELATAETLTNSFKSNLVFSSYIGSPSRSAENLRSAFRFSYRLQIKINQISILIS